MRQTQHSADVSATIAFIDLAGFSAIADVYGDSAAIDVLEMFESMVCDALSGYEPPIKWIGDEAMLSFSEPEIAIQALGTLLQTCRNEPRLPLTRAGLNHGPVIRRAGDLFGSTVNIAARIAALASPGQLLATRPIAEAAVAKGILVRDLGTVALRSVVGEVPLYEIELAPSADPAWIDPVCKMHAPYSSYRRAAPQGPWFCSRQCEEAYRRSPQTYELPR
ncbi:adenylate/guanylate cyclase domain-containing protein (plasmid) [Ensifer adhaerens]|uniref:adenylate/guanylate cyclase domain-containing protein n=1 Tax=Ensifer adhaerens TaxID=106592 RepID=UPI0023AA0093|nr:adenylate/guanylate cyclase domain-containing protein [Ensifer adhaerens]WDZ81726.1 adenylate/guanylate cyclase domain-containing protein [Ensifer adhaerens]